MSCRLSPLAHSLYVTQENVRPPLDPLVDVNMNRDELRFEVREYRDNECFTLGFDLRPRDAFAFADMVFSYYNRTTDLTYHELEGLESLVKSSREHYSVWFVKFPGEEDWLHWQSGSRPLDETFLPEGYQSKIKYFKYSS